MQNDEVIFGTEARYCWSSAIHQNFLRVGFTLQTSRSHHSDFKEDAPRLPIMGLTSEQCRRVITKSKDKTFEIVIPFDKIGHKDDLQIDLGDRKHILRLTVETDGISRILVIKDLDMIMDSYTVN